MKSNDVLVFTRNGLGQGPEDLQLQLAVKFLSLMQQSGQVPAKILFYTDGVKLACQGSPVAEILKAFEQQGTELLLCQTCLEYFQLRDRLAVGIVGGMADILEAIQKAEKVISL